MNNIENKHYNIADEYINYINLYNKYMNNINKSNIMYHDLENTYNNLVKAYTNLRTDYSNLYDKYNKKYKQYIVTKTIYPNEYVNEIVGVYYNLDDAVNYIIKDINHIKKINNEIIIKSIKEDIKYNRGIDNNTEWNLGNIHRYKITDNSIYMYLF